MCFFAEQADNKVLLAIVASTVPGTGRDAEIAAAKAEIKVRQESDEDLNDLLIDRFHDGYFAFRNGEARSPCPYMAEGWDDAERSSKVRVVMPRRPEGYYHAPLGAFD
jgi:hypothetical protein